MAGHSKWANIRHRKGAQDARRGKVFTKIIREISVAAKMGGGDPASNPRLRAAIDNGLGNNMPKDTIERAIKRGVGGDDTANLDELVYEGYGPGGVAVMVECMTDNRNRTAGEVRHAFTKHGGNLGTDGSVAYLFSKIGIISYDAGVSEDAVMEAALEAGAEDVLSHPDGSIDVMTSPENFGVVKDALDATGLSAVNAEVTMQASTNVELDLEKAETMLKMLDMLEDLDDVQKVYSNAEISDDIMAKLG
ncbi:MAG: YebC/PmpR family DNA-binding transcriptional regulator [Gammaproteobacteria bacterium]|nr:YebC/PmpR family DNA-binding transcriptional regulator [Gammaproteobacteria bacterium]